MRVKHLFAAAAVALSVMAHRAQAVVVMSLSDGDSSPNAATVAPGSTFTVTASVIATAERLTGVDYYLQASGAAAGKFRIIDRTAANSQFSDLIKPDNGDNAANPGVEDSAFSLLNPRNSLDLGASIANVSTALNPGSYVLATYTISVPLGLSAGTYTLSTVSDAGTGYVTEAPLFNEAAFAQQGSFSVTVTGGPGSVPEPSSLGALALAGMLIRRRR